MEEREKEVEEDHVVVQQGADPEMAMEGAHEKATREDHEKAREEDHGKAREEDHGKG